MSLNLVFKAFSDDTRREILRRLQQGDLTAGEIAACFDLTKPSISHHLNVLKQAELVQDVRKGQHIFYSLNTTVFQEVLGWIFEVWKPEVKGKGDLDKESKENLNKGGIKDEG